MSVLLQIPVSAWVMSSSKNSSDSTLVTLKRFSRETRSKMFSRIFPESFSFSANTETGSKQILFIWFCEIIFVSSTFKSSIAVRGENLRNFTFPCSFSFEKSQPNVSASLSVSTMSGSNEA